MDAHAAKVFCDRQKRGSSESRTSIGAKRTHELAENGSVSLPFGVSNHRLTWVVARREWTCCNCMEKIRAGMPYQKHELPDYDGEGFITSIWCAPCVVLEFPEDCR